MVTLTINVPDRLADVPAENLDAILRELAGVIEHADDTDPFLYETAVDRMFVAIRAAAEAAAAEGEP